MNISKGDFIGRLEPLDLILIQGTTAFSSLIMNGSEVLRGNGEFSHCALVVNKEICPAIKINDNRLLLIDVNVAIFEETTHIENGKISIGGQIRDLDKLLSEWINKGSGIGLCKLKNNPYTTALKNNDVLALESIRNKMNEIYTRYLCMGTASIYELNIFALLGTVFPQFRGARDQVNSVQHLIDSHPWIFCSELICIVYQDLGIIGLDKNPEEYVPVDFMDESIVSLPPIYLAMKPKRNAFIDRIFRALFCASAKNYV